MANTNKTSATNFFETFTEMPKKAFETLTQASEKMKEQMENFTKINPNAAQASDFFNTWYKNQTELLKNNSFANANTANPSEYFTNWYNTQLETGKKAIEDGMAWVKNAQNNEWVMNNNLTDTLEKTYNDMNAWNTNITSTIQEMIKGINGGEMKDYFKTMFNNADTYMKMHQIWAPIFKAVQDKTYTPEAFAQYFKPEMIKEMMDKMFQFVPADAKNIFAESQAKFKEQVTTGTKAFNDFKDQYTASLPAYFKDPFTAFNEQYQNIQNQIKQFNNPFMAMVTPGPAKDSFELANEINERFVKFNLSNTKVQYLVYTKGAEAIENFGKAIAAKVEKGESIENFMGFYTDFLNTIDAQMVELFSSDEFSKAQSEMGSIGMNLKKDVEKQIEKSMSGLPIVTRSEMDELYKTVYELNKKVKDLERELGGKKPAADKAEEPAKAKKATKA